MSKEIALEKITELVNRFEEHKESYTNSEYNETKTRRDFIDPFFKALGWDIDNEQSLAEAYREVIHEDKIRIDESIKAPDYCFTIYGQKKFYVEAKKPSVEIKESAAPAYQIRRYGWSAKLPISIITDFHEFAIYDCTKKPNLTDKASVARIKYITYKEYIRELDFLYDTFAKDNILKGRFDKFAVSDLNKKGTSSVDSEFLKSMEEWRKSLALNIAIRNDKLKEDEINFTVQQTIDRLIFLRICEDRKIEPYGYLKNLINTGSIYEKLFRYFQYADDKYNSGLFDFNKDKLSNSIAIDDKILKSMISEMYYPESPYEFSVIPVEILGNSYEQFLGSVIRLTSGHHAKVEVKPEVRKAGGVYYTPQYIVEYIVKNTVGKLIENKTPEQISKIRILDPACGSGSFLLGAYQYLLNYHLYYYIANNDNKKNKKSPLTPDGKLTTAEKKRILTNNIFGVDIDTQAVEVTKLSLLLKCLEGETEASVNEQMTLFKERVLPNLEDNIKCGNSLIDFDFYEGQLDFEPNEDKKIKPFNWEQSFPEVFRQGGFDVVIGNPPYLRIQGLQENYNNQLEYFEQKYTSAVKRYDLYLLFIEKGFKLIKNEGLLGYICPHKFINSDFGSGIRKFLLSNKAIKKLINLGHNLVFEQASTYTGLLFLTKEKNEEFNYYEFTEDYKTELPNQLYKLTDNDFATYNLNNFTTSAWILTSSRSKSILDKINMPYTLKDIFGTIMVGIQSGIDEVHILGFIDDIDNKYIKLFSDKIQKEIIIEKKLVKPLAMGNNVKRFQEPVYDNYIIYPYKVEKEKTVILEENELATLFPKGYKYLHEFKKEQFEIRERQKTNSKYWYSCHRSRDMNIFEQERIITPYASLGCNMTICPAGIYHNTKVYSLIPNEDREENKYFWLALFNSKIMWYFIKKTGYVLRGGYYTFTTDYLSPFPIKTIDFSNPIEKSIHNDIVKLVESMLSLNKELQNSKLPQEQEQLKNRIEYTDKKIDELVYKLYGLDKKEIEVIEGTL
ncbi:MAG: N-6 DNA methylase [Spirochaetota bacterium]